MQQLIKKASEKFSAACRPEIYTDKGTAGGGALVQTIYSEEDVLDLVVCSHVPPISRTQTQWERCDEAWGRRQWPPAGEKTRAVQLRTCCVCERYTNARAWSSGATARRNFAPFALDSPPPPTMLHTLSPPPPPPPPYLARAHAHCYFTL
ncbi:PREDICTED: uncharacterized protein LOC105366075 [Ceratosolen solmsi marchali]|uniref:Uncharacterized protein LOC105366075 n=1 Tax=Ceratosolen solmsi marchali TaxID=326594 RepID=A0AAJ6YR47_9HYME|nr:PREDICTED: uncharacterized protein LOC105366075 [Ceratosolen solmsi marchali]